MIGKYLAAGVGVFVAFFLLIGMVFGHPLRKAPADKIALSYGGGTFEGAAFQGITEPGSGLKFNGWFDKWYEYPVTVRDYIVSRTEGDGDRGIPDVIVAGSANGPQVEWEVAVNFKLNTNIIREFHEKLGLKFHAWENGGWNKMLDKTLRQQLEAAVQAESRKHTTDEYQKNPTVIEEVRRNIAAALKENVNESLGNDFFCGPTFEHGKPECPDFEVTVKKPSLPQGIIDAYNAQEASAQGVLTAQNEAKQAEERARGRKLEQTALEGIFNDPNYVAYLEALALQECAKNSNCTLVVTNGGTGVNVNTQPR